MWGHRDYLFLGTWGRKDLWLIIRFGRLRRGGGGRLAPMYLSASRELLMEPVVSINAQRKDNLSERRW